MAGGPRATVDGDQSTIYEFRPYRAANSRVKIIIAARLRVVVFGARLIADDVVWWRRRANQSLDASRTSGILIDNLRVTQLRAAASTPPLCRNT